MIVVDATVWVDKLCGILPQPMSDVIRTEGCVSPAHVDFEVGSALVRLERRGALKPGQARTLIEVFSSHPVERIYHSDDAVQATDFLENSTYADAWYVAMAKRLNCSVMTTDTGMRTAARIQQVPVVDDLGDH